LAFWGCWPMALVMILSIPVMIVSMSIQMMFMVGAGSMNEKVKIAQQIVTDSVQNARTVSKPLQ